MARFGLGAWIFGGACLLLAGCADHVRRPGAEDLARFEAAGRANPTVDMSRMVQARIAPGPYRVLPGDVLRLEMPRFLEQQPVSAGTDSRQTYNCRVADDGTIVLPIIGALVVRGKSLAQIESAIVAAYHPKYVAAPLPVYVSMLEYATQRVSVIGAVTQPGIHALRRDQMSLVGLLMEAGGIVGQGAAVIRITRAEERGHSTFSWEGGPPGPAPQEEPEDGFRRTEDGGQKTEDRRQRTAPSSVLRPLPSDNRPPSSAFCPPSSVLWSSPLSPVVRAVFVRDGPLRTTGWLRVEDGTGRMRVRQWLDLANEPQRREFLASLPAQGRGLDGLETKLAQLGAYLDGPPGSSLARSGAGGRISEDGGRTVDDGVVTGPPSSVLCPPSSVLWSSPPPGWRILADGSFTTAPAEPPPAPERRKGEGQREAGSLMFDGRSKKETGTPHAWDLNHQTSTIKLPTDPLAFSPSSSRAETRTLVLPVRGLSIPFADVVLEEGDAVVVEPPREQSISVLGLVTRPGLVPYPPGAQYTLIQAIALAGGLDLVANPRYVNVYRLDPQGQVVSATFQLVSPRRQPQLTDALSLPLKPGDVVSVEHTLRTRTNVFFDRVFRVSLGLYVNPESLWND